ncbi:hypothetical protein VFPPC_15250 [Pochonia chlamydosporia 170]|uniref:Uncharacterized protein n=1 Tax=Pochonia chlamydosporia 170 TaxID=1380566 RepID=A0A179G5J4_METCM|nr:hypothetical protein VFPPC_15250 [Pochonia chlamydosporia 170]OAQ73095.1 hypothetical protein VFPPC_15250 [Pochonia chlamydosporia 170]
MSVTLDLQPAKGSSPDFISRGPTPPRQYSRSSASSILGVLLQCCSSPSHLSSRHGHAWLGLGFSWLVQRRRSTISKKIKHVKV